MPSSRTLSPKQGGVLQLTAASRDQFGDVIAATAAAARHLIRKAGFGSCIASMGAVTLVRRFGCALNLNPHFHLRFLRGVGRLPTPIS